MTWRARDDAMLRALYPTHSYPDLARRFGRDVSTIRRRARALGLMRDPETQWRLHKFGVARRAWVEPHPMLAPDATPLENDAQEEWWARQRENDLRFQDQLRRMGQAG